MLVFGLMKCNFVGSKNVETPRVNISAMQYCEICCPSPLQKYKLCLSPENMWACVKFNKREMDTVHIKDLEFYFHLHIGTMIK
jgi:hypothetical protein